MRICENFYERLMEQNCSFGDEETTLIRDTFRLDHDTQKQKDFTRYPTVPQYTSICANCAQR